MGAMMQSGRRSGKSTRQRVLLLHWHAIFHGSYSQRMRAAEMLLLQEYMQQKVSWPCKSVEMLHSDIPR